MDTDKLRTVLEAIPAGRWTSYGDIANALGASIAATRAINRQRIRSHADFERLTKDVKDGDRLTAPLRWRQITHRREGTDEEEGFPHAGEQS